MPTQPQPLPEYIKYINAVKKVNDIYQGTHESTEYLEKFEREEEDKFKARQSNATIDNYVLRTTDSIRNIIFRKPISMENITNAKMQDIMDNIDLKNNDINEFAKELTVNVVKDGFSFIFVDSPTAGKNVTNKADEEANNIRPYMLNIKRKDLFYWETNEFGIYKAISFYESYTVKTGLFQIKTKTRIKAITDDGMVYIWEEGAKEPIITKRGINPITLVKVGDSDIPPLLDMSKLNIQQMNRKSEKSNYVRIGASPFPLVYGQIEQDGVEVVSISRGLSFSNKAESGFEWAEMTGKNHTIIKDEIESLNLEMQNISISFATSSKVMTATQVEKDSTEDESKLAEYANIIEDGLNKAIEYLTYYQPSLGKDQTISVNKDFDSNVLTPEQFNTLLQLRLNNLLSYEMMIDLLVKGEIIPYLDETERIKEKQLIMDEGQTGAVDIEED